MKYVAPLSFSAFLSIRAQELFTKTIWPSQCETKHMVGAERPLLLCLCHEAEGRVWPRVQRPTAARCLHECNCFPAHLCCQIPTLQKPLEKKHGPLAISFWLCETQLLLFPSLACSMELAGVCMWPFHSTTAGMLMFKIK